MIRFCALIVPLVASLVAASDTDRPFDWSTADLSYIGKYADRYRTSRALCASVISAEPPTTDRPTVEQAPSLSGCNSEELYYGIGIAADPVRARQCAILETEGEQYGGPSQPYFGKGMLAIIYANGIGARQNYNVAIHMACGLDNAPGENGPRIDRLARLRATKSLEPQFDTCLDTSSGALGGMCAAHQASVAGQAREGRVAVLARRWTPEARRQFAKLKSSAEDYFSTAHEMDCFRGTAQTQFAISGVNEDMEKLVAALERLQRGDAARLESEADRDRRRIARIETEASKEDMSWMPEVDRELFRVNAAETQTKRRAFERDLVAFARLTWPAVSSHRIRRIFANQ